MTVKSKKLTVKEAIHLTMENALKRSKKLWTGSPFEPLTTRTPDERGRWGEEFLFVIISAVAGIESTWNGDSNVRPKDGGTYDILVNLMKRLRNEVKTAFCCSKGARPLWQHENIYAKSVWDKLTFVDVDYDKIYITVLTPSNMAHIFNDEVDPILGKKATLREAQEDKWKFDYSRTTLANSIKAGYTFVWDYYNPDDEGVVNHLLKHFG